MTWTSVHKLTDRFSGKLMRCIGETDRGRFASCHIGAFDNPMFDLQRNNSLDGECEVRCAQDKKIHSFNDDDISPISPRDYLRHSIDICHLGR